MVDFGLSSFTSVDEYMFPKCGTPGFVAPEILDSSIICSSKYGTSVDMFSTGVILYILANGFSPFKG